MRITASRVVLVAALVLAVLALVLAALAATAYAGPPPGGAGGGNWWTSEHVLVLANIVLAGVTAATIYFSNRTARAAEAAVDQDRQALLTSTRPIIVEKPDSLTKVIQHQVPLVQIKIRNVGNGPAFLRRADFVAGANAPEEAISLDLVVIAPGQETTLAYLPAAGDRSHDELLQDNGGFAFAVNYDDISGTQRNRTVVRATFAAGQATTLQSVGLYGCDDQWRRFQYPFAGTDPLADETWWGHQTH